MLLFDNQLKNWIFLPNVNRAYNPLVIFDFDGTICQSLGAIEAALNTVRRQFGYRKITDDDVRCYVLRNSRDIVP
ncbi:MAG: Haloacid dehalogenase-like hydrolase [Candidatus Kentron sp. G]|nr:MAG: Haloacid dehalogenase-like hydrolase [Candidatus Kentron sp. G]